MIFQPFQPSDIVSGRVQSVTNGLWSNGTAVATTFYINPSQTMYTGSDAFDILNGAYYYNVYDLDPTPSGSTATVKFSVSYGNSNGSGSLTDLSLGSTLATQAVYNQFKNLILDPDETLFTFQQSGSVSGYQSNDIYIINFATIAFKDELDNGTIQFNLAGNNGTFSFIDDSSISTTTTTGTSGQVYNIVNGSVAGGIYNAYDSAGRGFGLFYPDLGLIILNPVAVADLVGANLLPNLATDRYYQNQGLLFTAIQQGVYFQALSTEFIPTTNYFVRVGNQSFNYSNNPTFVTSSNGVSSLTFSRFSTDPQVYITTVGLYDNNSNLVAVAKLSEPTLKTFETEALIKVRLNF